ncbi:zinc finger HIT domain-containing protein 1-like [Gordionus sp. m RMFG-2023]|uniref:zinc finger HIT domain-containing protein 1-like n=1 Tax=Gordionus sp. m RMFG-2023 TaxID=3053472 RepID=UPI0031FDD3FD
MSIKETRKKPNVNCNHNRLDDVAKSRRLNKKLELLENDNFQEDPHANVIINKKAPRFDETSSKSKKKRKTKNDWRREKYKKSLAVLLEEQVDPSKNPNYYSIKAKPPKLPPRHFCSVCGNFSNYTCIQCELRYCSIKCQHVHKDTRCLKWIA